MPAPPHPLAIPPSPTAAPLLNIARELPLRAEALGSRRAIVEPRGRGRDGRWAWAHVTYAQLDARVDRMGHALAGVGLARGDRVVLLARPGIDLIALVYALFKLGAVPVLIDPGMGRAGLLRAMAEARPRAFLGISLAQALLRLLGGGALPPDAVRVRVGRGPTWGALDLEQLLAAAPDDPFPSAPTRADETAAILFTSGSTGPAKGVVYEHGMFAAQLRTLRETWGLGPEDVDLPGLPVFALFSVALGATVVFPEMDYRRPARLDPRALVEAILDHGVTYSFGSPAIWGPVARYCVQEGIRLPTLRRVFMAGAPVPPAIHEDLAKVLPEGGETFTPFGATEALPVTAPSGRELARTFAASRLGRGTCVGRALPGIEVEVIPLEDEPIASWHGVPCLPPGEVGELVVRGPVVTKAYFAREEATARAKIPSEGGVWHRMGDLGYRDAEGRLWFCGRVSHLVTTLAGPLYPVCVEAVFNQHPRVRRTALVGVGPAGAQRAVLVVEPLPGQWPRGAARERLFQELRALGAAHEHTRTVDRFLLHRAFPVDVRHNAKIRREELAAWAAGQP